MKILDIVAKKENKCQLPDYSIIANKRNSQIIQRNEKVSQIYISYGKALYQANE
ncbi:MAG: hypothetical protein HRT69_18910 [Flavobacteriaceae bacterium]|nr:hypothetical protein [Flavobacteriaceae bacterium]